MTPASFTEEFFTLSRMLDSFNSPDAAKLQYARLVEVFGKLRRKNRKDARWVIYNRSHSQTKHLQIQPSEKRTSWESIIKLLLLLRRQLIELLQSLDSHDGSLELTLGIDHRLDQIAELVSLVRNSSRWDFSTMDIDDDEKVGVTDYKSARLVGSYDVLKSHLAILFDLYRSFFQTFTISNPINLEQTHEQEDHEQIKSRKKDLGLCTSCLKVLIDDLVETFDQSNLSILQDEWTGGVNMIGEILSDSMKLFNSPRIKNDPNQSIYEKQINGFILIAKLSRLLLNKICKITNSQPHLSSQMDFDQLESLQLIVDTVPFSLYDIFRMINVPPPHDPSIPESIEDLAESVDECFKILTDHFDSISASCSDDSGQDPTLTFRSWCISWKKNFYMAMEQFLIPASSSHQQLLDV